jgi:hypothetical protein
MSMWVGEDANDLLSEFYSQPISYHPFGIRPFFIDDGAFVFVIVYLYVLFRLAGPLIRDDMNSDTNRTHRFTFATTQNAMHTRYIRVLRAMYACHSRAILLEGPPGVGKSELVAALARYTGHSFVRINLSEQTVCDVYCLCLFILFV